MKPSEPSTATSTAENSTTLILQKGKIRPWPLGRVQLCPHQSCWQASTTPRSLEAAKLSWSS